MACFKAIVCQESKFTKVALLKDGNPLILDADVLDRPGQLDAIYQAKIIKKESNSYWCDVGLNRPALLAQEKELPRLQEGEKVLVQISREAFDDAAETSDNHFQKPVKLTQNIILSHQACLYFPLRDSFKERSASPLSPLASQQQQLKAIYKQIVDNGRLEKPGMIYAGPTLIERFLKDLPPHTIVHVAPPELMIMVRETCQLYRPDLLENLSIKHTDLFQEEGLEDAWQSCLEPVISFSHGKIIIESTSCVTSIDVNGPIGKATEVNKQALTIIAEQLKWRRLSGNIIIDFMADGVKEKQILLQKLSSLLASDRPRWKILRWSDLGWLELQRSKRRISLPSLIQRYQHDSF